uniref:Oxidoreductase n=2 Tax=Podospora anserina TaxID=2587412 RepID=A0A090D4N1_PODAN|nr:Putative oxidoreductase [Podospora anserina]CDP24348.1 Putative oxidoreductase [Podospora anserina S mat+]
MPEPQVIIITGASRGIGHAIATHLLKAGHKVVLTARSPEKLEELQKEYPSQVQYLAADMTLPDTPYKLKELALLHFHHINAVIINHGALSPMTRVANSSIDDWKALFDANFFSALALAKETIPYLRETKGRLIFTSSGAATGAYTAWGAYGTSKAALNHLSKHIAVEEPDITSVAVSPGRVDTDMQKELREKGKAEMAPKDHEAFSKEFEAGTLVRPEQSGGVIANLAVSAKPELAGQYFKWNAPELAEYQLS